MGSNNVSDRLTAPERLQLLLPWINDATLSDADVREALWQFLEPPTPKRLRGPGDPVQSGYTRLAVEGAVRELVGYQGKDGIIPKASARKLQQIRIQLRRVLDGQSLPLTLRFSVKPSSRTRHEMDKRRREQKLTLLSPAERKAYLEAGHYVVAVDSNSLRDLVVYQFMRLLTTPGAATLARCPAPAPRDPNHQCGGWLIATGKRRGHPARYCSSTCRVRAFNRQRQEHVCEA